MSYLKVFGVLTEIGVDVSKIFGVGAGVLKHGAGVQSESEKVTPLVSGCQVGILRPNSRNLAFFDVVCYNGVWHVRHRLA